MLSYELLFEVISLLLSVLLSEFTARATNRELPSIGQACSNSIQLVDELRRIERKIANFLCKKRSRRQSLSSKSGISAKSHSGRVAMCTSGGSRGCGDLQKTVEICEVPMIEMLGCLNELLD